MALGDKMRAVTQRIRVSYQPSNPELRPCNRLGSYFIVCKRIDEARVDCSLMPAWSFVRLRINAGHMNSFARTCAFRMWMQS